MNMCIIARQASRSILLLFASVVLSLCLLWHSTPSNQGYDSASAYSFPKDVKNHAFNGARCAAAFPDFYSGIDTAVDLRKSNPVQLDELEIEDNVCLLRVLIFDAELFIIQGALNEGCWIQRWHERTSGLLHSIHRAILSVPPETIPNVEFILDLDDDPQRPINVMHGVGSNKSSVWGLTRLLGQAHIWLVPDYAYWAWPSALVSSHNQIRRKMMEANTAYPWQEKISMAVWRGTTHLNPNIRKTLIEVADAASWGDAKVCDIYEPQTKKDCITQDQHCRYKFLIHTEGYTYSGRLKYLQLCNSVPVAHHLKWIEHHHHLMRSSGPNQNYIQVNNDWSDLASKIGYYLHHEEEAEMIAENSHRTFYERYLTPAATSCYWRRLITSWATVQGFEPQLYEKDASTGENVLRGIPFEVYAIDAKKPMPDI